MSADSSLAPLAPTPPYSHESSPWNYRHMLLSQPFLGMGGSEDTVLSFDMPLSSASLGELRAKGANFLPAP